MMALSQPICVCSPQSMCRSFRAHLQGCEHNDQRIFGSLRYNTSNMDRRWTRTPAARQALQHLQSFQAFAASLPSVDHTPLLQFAPIAARAEPVSPLQASPADEAEDLKKSRACVQPSDNALVGPQHQPDAAPAVGSEPHKSASAATMQAPAVAVCSESHDPDPEAALQASAAAVGSEPCDHTLSALSEASAVAAEGEIPAPSAAGDAVRSEARVAPRWTESSAGGSMSQTEENPPLLGVGGGSTASPADLYALYSYLAAAGVASRVVPCPALGCHLMLADLSDPNQIPEGSQDPEVQMNPGEPAADDVRVPGPAARDAVQLDAAGSVSEPSPKANLADSAGVPSIFVQPPSQLILPISTVFEGLTPALLMHACRCVQEMGCEFLTVAIIDGDGTLSMTRMYQGLHAPEAGKDDAADPEVTHPAPDD